MAEPRTTGPTATRPGPGSDDGGALSVENLGATLGGRQILSGISLSAQGGAITTILGPNGAGKTTLLECMAGLLAHTGRIAVGACDLAGLPARQRARLIAYVPQRSALDAPLRVATVVGHGLYAHTGSSIVVDEDRARVEQAMAATDVSAFAERSYLALSGGEQRRVLIARALATGARILLLDEPTASLDVGHALALFRLMRALADDGVCVIVVLHDLNDALVHTDRAVLLSKGAIAAFGPVAEVVSDEPIRQVYGVEPERAERLVFRLREGVPEQAEKRAERRAERDAERDDDVAG